MPRPLLALILFLAALLAPAEAWARARLETPAPVRVLVNEGTDSRQGSVAQLALYTHRLVVGTLRAPSGTLASNRRRASGPGNTEVYDMRARQWVPELGVFLSIDEYAFHDARSTLWGWPGQNPIRWRDPTGHCGPLCAVGIGAGAGALVGAGIYAATTSNFSWGGLAGAGLEGGIIGGAFGVHPAAGVLALGTLGVANENDLWKFGLAPIATKTKPAEAGGSCPAKKSVDPQLKADVEAALSEAKAEASHQTLYHGGNLVNGEVQPGSFSTTPSPEHAAQYGPLNQFNVPTEVLNAAIENGDVQVLRDSRAGSDGYATEYRFRGDYSPNLNQYRVP